MKDGDQVDPSIVRTLFHPHLHFSEPTRPAWPSAGEPFRVLFLGRVLPYKGLDLLIEAIEGLRATGLAIELGVFGEGALGSSADRLKAMGAEVENRWLSANEMSAVIARYHAIALSHKEASQSGIAALAAGHCVPVVANPVGGLVEQIIDGRTGIIASAAKATALGEAIASLARDCRLSDTITSALQADCDHNSMGAYLSRVLECLTEAQAQETHVGVPVKDWRPAPRHALSRVAPECMGGRTE